MKSQIPLGIEPLEARIAPAFGALFELSSLTGSNGFKISGEATYDYSSAAVSDAGDVNGDGFADLLIGAYRADPNGDSSGAAYVVFGKAGGFNPNLNLSSLDGANGFKISGVAASDRAGSAVSGAGDVNGDGFADVLIGAYIAAPNGRYSGAAYVVFGKAGGFNPNLNLSSLDGVNGFKISGVAAYDRAGSAVSGAGDVNGDGFADLLIGAFLADPNGNSSGAAYVVFGKAGGFNPNLNLSSLDGVNGFKLAGVAAYDRAGAAVSGAGDVNGDGFADLLIGAYGADPNGNSSGAAYVVFGKAGAFNANLNLSDLDGVNGFRISGVAAYDRAGSAVSGAGDVNGDGFADLLIGAFRAVPNGIDSGAAYVVFGKSGGLKANLNLSSLDGANGFKLSGVAPGFSSGAVSKAGDVNGDGFDDLLIGADGADPNGSYSGAAYLVFGEADGFSANLNLLSLDGASGFKINGVSADDRTGFAVSGGGDVNRDGFADLLIGAHRADPNGVSSGASYVIFGQLEPAISIDDIGVSEGDSVTVTVPFTVRLSAPSSEIVTVQVATADGTASAPGDYTASGLTTLTFNPGEVSKPFVVSVNGDTAFEPNETFFVNLINATNAILADPQAQGTVLNDDVQPAALVVTTAADTIDPSDGVFSLREAILLANQNSGLDTITFNIPGASVHTITPKTVLPAITDAVIIDGYSQPGSSPNTLADGDDAMLLIELDGSQLPVAAQRYGLDLRAGDSTVRGLVVHNFADIGIFITNGGNNVIAGNFLGTNPDGLTASAGSGEGVDITLSSNNHIGGADPADRNLISGNELYPINILGGSSAAKNAIQGNFIGTTKNGTAVLTNGNALTNDGQVSIDGDNTILGGSALGAGNVIACSAPTIDAVSLSGSGSVALGNYIGLDVTGSRALGVAGAGIHIFYGVNVVIGGASAGEGNVIGGAAGGGIILDSNSGGTRVLGNFIGTDASGMVALPNSGAGIQVLRGADDVIGGTGPGEGNLISGNLGDGVRITGSNTSGTMVLGNFIGTDKTGTVALGNRGDGVEISNAAHDNIIGGNTTAARNIISGNVTMTGSNAGGVRIADANRNVVAGNFIGPDVSGLIVLPGNDDGGVIVGGDSDANVIGGATAAEGNVIITDADGVDVIGGARHTMVRGNFIGAKADGSFALDSGNGLGGVLVGGGADATTLQDNLIAGNEAKGVLVVGLATDTVLRGNTIVRNDDTGVDVENAIRTVIEGNFIGTDRFGKNLANSDEGIYLQQVSGMNVGDIAPGAGNTIAFNQVGIVLQTSASGVAIRGNSIFSNGGLGIDLGANGVTTNDALDADTGANGLQNYPVLNSVTTGAGGTSISGSFNSAANASFTIDFYASFAADPSGFGEGEVYLGSINVTTDASGNAAGNFSPGAPLPAGTQITATATDAGGNTSEFSAALLIAGTSTNFVWDGGGGTDTNWFNALNWAPDGVPGVLDSAVLDSNATITLATSAFIGSFTQSDGVLTGPGALKVNGFTWSGGTEDGPGMTLIGTGGFLSIEGAALKILSQRTLENGGAGVWSGTGDLQLSVGAIFKNSGSLEIRNDANFVGITDNVQPRFINKGTLEKTGGSGVTLFSNVDVENSGTFRISAGTVLLSGTSTFTQTDGTTVLSGGSLSASGLLTFEGGKLSGAGTIVGDVINSGARVEPGGNKTAGTLSINGDYTQGAAATLSIELGGTIAGNQYDQLLIGGTANLGGTLEINTLGSFKIADGSSFNVLTYPSVNGDFAVLDAPSGITTAPGASGLLLNAQTPASGPRAMTVTDVDGDVVTLKVNKGSIPSDAITLGPNGELQRIDLRAVGSKLGGASFTISVEQAGGGDGAVNVGAIEASGMNLGKVRIAGDLGQIDIGTGEAHKAALKSLSLQSLGTMGASTQMAGTLDPLLSEISGALNKLTVERDVKNAVVEVSDKLGKVRIGGNLIDNAPATPAQLQVARGRIGVFLNGGIPPVGASHAGTLFAADIGSVTVMGNIDGGEISAETGIKNVKVVGSLRSDDALDPAILRVGANIDKVLIKGDVQNALILAGYNKDLEPRNPDAHIGQITVKGSWSASSVVAGVADPGDDGFGQNDALIAGDQTANVLARIASVIIKGMATGSTTPSDHSAITAQKIGELRINGDKIPLTQGLDDLNLDPLNQNFRAVEL